MQPQRIVFLYNLYVPKGTELIDAESSMRDVEARLHEALTEQFLTCDADEDMAYGMVKDFYIWSISSAPVDTLTLEDCTTDYSNSTKPPENSECVQVMGNFGMIAFFPAGRRALESWTEADQQVLDDTGYFLDYSMEEGDYNDEIVLQTQFQGFVAPSDANSPSINGANTQLQSSKVEARRTAGATAVVLSALVLSVVALLIYRRKRRNTQMFLQYVEDMSDCSDLYKDGASVDHTVNIVNDVSFDWDNDGKALPPPSPTGIKSRSGRLSRGEIENQHDVHKVCFQLSWFDIEFDFCTHCLNACLHLPISVHFCLLHRLSGDSKPTTNVSPFYKSFPACSRHP